MYRIWFSSVRRAQRLESEKKKERKKERKEGRKEGRKKDRKKEESLVKISLPTTMSGGLINVTLIHTLYVSRVSNCKTCVRIVECNCGFLGRPTYMSAELYFTRDSSFFLLYFFAL